MKLIRSLTDAESFRGGYVSIGNFDGVHRGHQSMLASLVRHARADGVTAVALTFDPHPIALLRPEAAPPALTTIEHRAELVGRYGVDGLIAMPTDKRLLSLTAEEFFESVLLRELRVRGLVEGPNFFFGRGRAGNVTVLRGLCSANGLLLEIVPPVTVDDQLVSSSVIRSLIEAGDIDHANHLLGHEYRVGGTVTSGAQRGRLLGFPTANLSHVTTLVPANGVYAAWADAGDGPRPAAVHVGPNPTFGDDARKIEAHLIDFHGDLYGRQIDVDFVTKIRDVCRFDSPDQLRHQLHQDIATARAALRSHTAV